MNFRCSNLLQRPLIWGARLCPLFEPVKLPKNLDFVKVAVLWDYSAWQVYTIHFLGHKNIHPRQICIHMLRDVEASQICIKVWPARKETQTASIVSHPGDPESLSTEQRKRSKKRGFRPRFVGSSARSPFRYIRTYSSTYHSEWNCADLPVPLFTRKECIFIGWLICCESQWDTWLIMLAS